MGWVGVGSLIATAGYFVYRYPPRSWTERRPSAPPEPESDSPPAAATADEPSLAKKDGAGGGEVEAAEDESQTTPKASASSAPARVLEVPMLDLDGDASESRAASEASSRRNMNGSAQQPSRIPEAKSSQQPPSLTPAPLPQTQQRPPAAPATTTTDANPSFLMPPPPVPRPRPTTQPNQASRSGQLHPPRPSNAGSALRPPSSAAASLRVPPSGGSRLSSSTLAPTPPTLKKSSAPASRKVVLEPGYSPLDWAVLTSKPNNQLRGAGLPPGLLRVTPSMLKTQNGRKGRDSWTSYQGKVYNITPYVPYHPGGKGEILRGAGRDSAQLFQEIHPWVNWDGILGECLVGILVSESDAAAENSLDAMD